MTKRKIEHPKVFISYAWADEAYEKLVLGFASQLMSDGIDVIFDKWDLTEGNDTYAFMERCASDPSVTNVLMLLDPVYATKADQHSGGVGTETQIISAKVYNEVTQDKFIPVVMKRDPEGNVCKPTYLQGRLHFDLSTPEKYDTEYPRLVKTLYGEEIYAKPELGPKPSWVEKPIVVIPKALISYDALKGTQPQKEKSRAFAIALNKISDKLKTFADRMEGDILEPNDYIALYDETESIRSDFLQLVSYALYVEESHRCLADFFEENENYLPQHGNSHCSDIVKIRIHELFIYSIAFFLKNKDYSAAGYLLGRTYYNTNNRLTDYGADSYAMFYSGAEHQGLDQSIDARDDKRYLSGTGKYWIETLDPAFCSKEQFVFADLICFNYSVYGSDYRNLFLWFPITYVYSNRYNSEIERFSKKLTSHEFAQEVLPLFGTETVADFYKKVKEIEDGSQEKYREMRYRGCFESAPLLGNYIKAKDIGSFR
ncbi:MAG: hypothetical protein E7426_05165 [Ruminococcaceae bacterium]|nr:hypothetical protein [Oscillospiraceae bacterium]